MNEETIQKAEKLLVGIQLIAENSEEVIESGMVSHSMKYKLKNLLNRCLEFEKMFWGNLQDEPAQLEFQKKVEKIEKLIL